ncbi:MAG: RecQ family ATP-dependent DNA helicase [Bacteroidales bacterium]
MATIHEILKQYWGYDQFRPLQEDIINSVLSGNDTLGLMPTGGGKSITFQVPALMQEGVCLVVTPLIALMKDQKDNLRARGIKAAAVYSGMSRQEIIVALENCIFGDYKFLYVSPERLTTELFLAKLRAMKVSMLVVDESHCISQWGYDFRPSYLRIAEIRELLPDIPVLALTATATPEVVKDIQTKLHFRKENVFRKSFDRPNLAYVVRNTDNKIEELKKILNRVSGTAIVYVRSRKRTKEISEALSQAGIPSDYYHAGLSHETKEKKQEAWKKDLCRVIVSTNAFGMGIDKPDVRVVVHMDLPNSPEEYFQEAGRAGRDEQTAYAVILYSNSDQSKLRKRISDSFPEREFIRNVYHSLGNFFQIAEGAGFEAVFDFEPARFCSVYKYPMIPVHHALKLLQQAGYIEYDPEADSLSRLMFTVKREELYRLKEYDVKTNLLINTLLRSYTGLFADYVFIREEILMQRTNLSRQDIYERMVMLSRQHILHYIPAKKGPLIVFTQSRQDADLVRIPKAVYEDMKDRYSHRIESMINYATSETHCRTRILLKYFGEKSYSDCGRCDICLSQKEGSLTASLFKKIEKEIRDNLIADNCTQSNLTENLNYPEKHIIETLRYLIDEGFVKEENNQLMLIK